MIAEQGSPATSLEGIRLTLHVLAASIWVGGQFVMAGLVPTARKAGPEVPKTPRPSILPTVVARVRRPARHADLELRRRPPERSEPILEDRHDGEDRRRRISRSGRACTLAVEVQGGTRDVRCARRPCVGRQLGSRHLPRRGRRRGRSSAPLEGLTWHVHRSHKTRSGKWSLNCSD